MCGEEFTQNPSLEVENKDHPENYSCGEAVSNNLPFSYITAISTSAASQGTRADVGNRHSTIPFLTQSL
jgi:hypothetical protein